MFKLISLVCILVVVCLVWQTAAIYVSATLGYMSDFIANISSFSFIKIE